MCRTAGARVLCATAFSMSAVTAIAAGLALTIAPSAGAQCNYEVVGVMRGPSCAEGGRMRVTAVDINEIGHATGFAEPCPGSNETTKPFVWADELGVKLLILPSEAIEGKAVAINNVPGFDGVGVVAATLTLLGTQGDRAYRYDDGNWTQLPPESGLTLSLARGINDTGAIAGSRMTSSGLVGFCWHGGEFTHLFTNRGENMLALDINSSGKIAGELVSRSHASLWDGLCVQDLGTVFGGTSAFARALSDTGYVTGGAMINDEITGTPRLHAFLIPPGQPPIDLGIPEGCDSSVGVDVNDAGQVLMRCFTLGATITFRTYLWQNGAATPLSSLVQPPAGIVVGEAAEAINNRGEIVTTGWENGEQVGLVLAPGGSAAGDVNIDCSVDFYDVVDVIENWGPCITASFCRSDVVSSSTFAPPGDGKVDAADLAAVLAAWAP